MIAYLQSIGFQSTTPWADFWQLYWVTCVASAGMTVCYIAIKVYAEYHVVIHREMQTKSNAYVCYIANYNRQMTWLGLIAMVVSCVIPILNLFRLGWLLSRFILFCLKLIPRLLSSLDRVIITR